MKLRDKGFGGKFIAMWLLRLAGIQMLICKG
jgi:hypothetical protein